MVATRIEAEPALPRRTLLFAAVAAVALGAAGCAIQGTAPSAGGRKHYSPLNLVKADLDHFAEISQRRIFDSLRRLADKLYRRNPREWPKSGAGSVQAAQSRLFEQQHGWRLSSLGFRRGVEALQVAFHADFRGDRVQAFIVGLASMVQTAFSDRVEFFVLDELDAQRLYNAARNVEIAAWKLRTSVDAEGRPLLLSNEIGEVTNLSFEREFGRIIGHLEVLSDVVEERTERNVTRVVQNIATAVFLPVF